MIPRLLSRTSSNSSVSTPPIGVVIKTYMAANGATEPGGWISWGEIDYSNWKIVRTEEGKDVEDNLTALLEMIGTLGGTRPNWSADECVLPRFAHI